MNRRGLTFILVGLIAAIAAAAVVYNLSNNLTRTTGNPVATPLADVSTKKIVVAVRVVEPGALVVTDAVTLKDWPADLVPAKAYTSTALLIGTTAQVRLTQGLPIVEGQTIKADGRQGLSAIIPAGFVLVAFPSTDILNSTGAVQRGDRVDIMLTLPISGTSRLDSGAPGESQVGGGRKDLVAQLTLQDIEVYNTGEWLPPEADPERARSLKIITFIVDRQQALILKFVKDSGGIIDLVVRSLKEQGEVATDPVNLDYLVDTYKFIGVSGPNP